MTLKDPITLLKNLCEKHEFDPKLNNKLIVEIKDLSKTPEEILLLKKKLFNNNIRMYTKLAFEYAYMLESATDILSIAYIAMEKLTYSHG